MSTCPGARPCAGTPPAEPSPPGWRGSRRKRPRAQSAERAVARGSRGGSEGRGRVGGGLPALRALRPHPELEGAPKCLGRTQRLQGGIARSAEGFGPPPGNRGSREGLLAAELRLRLAFQKVKDPLAAGRAHNGSGAGEESVNTAPAPVPIRAPGNQPLPATPAEREENIPGQGVGDAWWAGSTFPAHSLLSDLRALPGP